MRRLSLTLVLLAILAGAGSVWGETYSAIELGDQLIGEVPDEDPVVIPFLGLSRSLATFQVVADAGSFPQISVLTPERTELPVGTHSKFDKKGRKVVVKKLELPASGRYCLLLTTKSPTAFVLKTKAKLLKKLAERVPISQVVPRPVEFAALPGTLLSEKTTRPGFSVLMPRIVGVLDPDGAEIDLSP